MIPQGVIKSIASEKVGTISSALFDFSDFHICDLGCGDVAGNFSAKSKLQFSEEMKKFTETESLAKFIESCIVADMVTDISLEIVKTIKEKSVGGPDLIVSHRAAAEWKRKGHDISRVTPSSSLPYGEVVSFDKDKLKVTMHREMQFKSDKMKCFSWNCSMLTFKLPILIEYGDEKFAIQ